MGIFLYNMSVKRGEREREGERGEKERQYLKSRFIPVKV
jgi:hypothetical protein